MVVPRTLVRLPRLRMLAAQLAMVMAAMPAVADEGSVLAPSLALSFTTPSVVVSPTDEVELWVTLSVSDGPLTFDTASSSQPFGLHPDLLPAYGFDYSDSNPVSTPFGSYSHIGLFTSRSCDDQVTFPNCSPEIYEFTVPAGSSTWFNSEQPFEIEAGSSRDFLLATLQPVGGAAPVGSYSIFNVGLGVIVYGLAEDGTTELEAEAFSANTSCPSDGSGCAFTITVVPEPNAAWLMLAGIVPVWLRVRRRRLQ